MTLARTIGQRSLCSRDRVGAVIVSAENRIIDTGYNGPPRGFAGVRAAEKFPEGLRPCVEWCPRAQVEPGFDGETLAADYSDCPSLHAEANALMFSDRRLREGGTIYVSSGTCSGCAKLVANSGLARAVYAEHNTPHRDSQRWYDFMTDCGLRVDVI